MAAKHVKLTAVLLLVLLFVNVDGVRRNKLKKFSTARFGSTKSIGYGINGDSKEWNVAKTDCATWNAKLAFPNSPKEFEDIRGFLEDLDGTTREIHVGFHSKFVRHEFVTIEGLKLNTTGYRIWNPRSANAPNERCGALSLQGLRTIDCSTPMWSLCEYPGVSYERVGDFGYFAIHDQPRNWSSASELCRMEDAYLLVLRSVDEFAALFAHLVDRLDAVRILYGAHALFGDQQFFTMADETLQESGFDLWTSGQPSNASNVDLPLVNLILGDPNEPETEFGLTLGELDAELPYVCKRELHK